MIDHTVSKSNCLECGHALDGATPTDDNPIEPVPGDISVCLYCAAIAEYGPNQELQPLSFDKFAVVSADPHVARVREAVLSLRKKES